MKKEQQLAAFRTIRNFVIKLVCISTVFILIWHFLMCFSVIRGESMYPRLRDGDLVGVDRLTREFSTGDVLVARRGQDQMVGRVVARSGDRVSISSKGGLYVNGVLQSEQIFYETLPMDGCDIDLVVPADSYYLLSDFRQQGADSRVYGCVAKDEVLGSVFFMIRRRGI